jgi:dephospho-CoA kinase
MKIVAIVGMSGAGKSEVAQQFEKSGYIMVRFGDSTDDEVKNRGLVLNEANERLVREQLRKEHGMAAYAKLNIPRIDTALKKSDVVADGLYSWEEFVLLKNYYGDSLKLVAVWASPQTRYNRLTSRKVRPLSVEQGQARDRAEIENSNKGGPIAMADYLITNESSLQELLTQTKKVIARLA